MPTRFVLLPLLLFLTACGGGGGGAAPGAMIDTHGLFLGDWDCWVEPDGAGEHFSFGMVIQETPQAPETFWARAGMLGWHPQPCFMLEESVAVRSGNAIEFDSGLLVLWLETDQAGGTMAGWYEITSGPCNGESGAVYGLRAPSNPR